MRSIVEFKNYLKSSEIDITNLEFSGNILRGVLNGKHLVHFELDEKEGRFYLYSFEKDATYLNELVPMVNTYMKDNPCVKYHSKNTVYDMDDTTIEWDKEKEERIHQLRTGHVKDFQFIYDIKPYEEDRYLRDMRLGFTTFSKVFFPNGYVCDNDGITMESKIATYNEQDCFLALDILENFMNKVYAGTWRGILPDPVDVEFACEMIRNRVNLLYTGSKVINKDFKHSTIYLKWYQKWKDYFTYEKKCEYMEKRMKGEDCTFLAPVENEKDKVKTIGSLKNYKI